MNGRKVLERSLYYFQQGYSFTSLPFAFLGYASSIYYLAVQNVPFLLGLFPSFSSFLLVAAATLPILCAAVGFVYMKRSWFFRAEQEVHAESTPWSYKLTPGISRVLYGFQAVGAEMNLAWWRKLGLSSQEVEAKYGEYVRLLRFLAEGGDVREWKG